MGLLLPSTRILARMKIGAASASDFDKEMDSDMEMHSDTKVVSLSGFSVSDLGLSLSNAPTSRQLAVPERGSSRVVSDAGSGDAVVLGPVMVHPFRPRHYVPVPERSSFLENEGAEECDLTEAGMKNQRQNKLRPPAVDEKRFTADYRLEMTKYWELSCDDEEVLRYLNTGDATDKKRGAAFRKFIPILHQLQKEYLSPEMFAQYEGQLYKWECTFPMPESNYGGTSDLVHRLESMKDPKNDSCLPAGVSLLLSLWDAPCCKMKASWNPWFYVKKSAIFLAGNGLFAAREFQVGETIGFCVGHVVYRYPMKWTEVATDEFLEDQGSNLKDDTRTMSLVDKEGYRVLVNPTYGVDGNKIAIPSLLMGMHFVNDFTKCYTDKALKKKVQKGNNVTVDDRGGVKANKRIYVNQELFLLHEAVPYEDENRREGEERKVRAESPKSKKKKMAPKKKEMLLKNKKMPSWAARTRSAQGSLEDGRFGVC